MTALDLAVVVGGGAAIVWVNWYFLFAGRGPVAVGWGGKVQEMEIRVEGGYSPREVLVRRGVPVRLVFDRRETGGCSEEVVLPDFGIRRYLPAHEKTVVEFTPEAAGSYEFTCGMGMLRGRVVVEEGGEEA